MKLANAITPTPVARKGTTVRDVIRACIAADVRAIPYVDENDRVVGLCSLKNIVKRAIVPDWMVQSIKLLGDDFQVLEDAQAAVGNVLGKPIEPYVYKSYWPVAPETPLIKAIAVMQTNRTDYAFVIDRDNHYHGIVTVLAIARRMLEEHPER